MTKSPDDIAAYLRRFERDHFQSQNLPDDLKKLMIYQQSNGLKTVFKAVDVVLRQVGQTHSLISHDYLNAAARANFHTMANVQAMNEISDNMGVVAFGNFGPEGAIGFWPMDAEDKDLFSLDNEGQYHLCLGETVSETLYFEAIVHEYEAGKAELETLFGELGILFNPAITTDDIYKKFEARKAATRHNPQKQRNSRYDALIAKPDEILGYEPASVGPVPDEAALSPFWKFWKRRK